MCEKNGPDSPSGLARTARSARLRFCLFRRFVFIQGVCLSRRGEASTTCSRQAYALVPFVKKLIYFLNLLRKSFMLSHKPPPAFLFCAKITFFPSGFLWKSSPRKVHLNKTTMLDASIPTSTAALV